MTINRVKPEIPNLLLAITSLIILISLGLSDSVGIWAQTPVPSELNGSEAKFTSQPSSLAEQITYYEDVVAALSQRRQTLANQLALYDQQTKLAQLSLGKSASVLKDLEKQQQIVKTALIQKKTLLAHPTGTWLDLVLLPNPRFQSGLSSFLRQKIFVTNQRWLVLGWLANLGVRLQENYEQRLKLDNLEIRLQEKQAQINQLKSEVERYRQQLVALAKDKEDLLSVSQNSQAQYDRLLSLAQRELAGIVKAAGLVSRLPSRAVKRGETIGRVGASGRAFGAHLHFGIYRVSDTAQYTYEKNHEDPGVWLAAKTVSWDSGCSGDPKGKISLGLGSLLWPLDSPDVHISQGYGLTCYAKVYYAGKPHPGWDLYSSQVSAVRAVEQGQAYTCRNCTGDGGNGVFIVHPNGLLTLYWHLE